jgi:hypothetical protein
MTVIYKIQFALPLDYDPTQLFLGLPSPVHRKHRTEVYNYSIEDSGFRFEDRLVDESTASVALRRFVDEGIRIAGEVRITAQ